MTTRATFARGLSFGAALALAAWLLPLAPASAGDGVGDDPEQAVQEFEAKTRKEVGDAVAELSKEVEDLRAQLKRAEAGLRRLQAMQRALDGRTDPQAVRSSYADPTAPTLPAAPSPGGAVPGIGDEPPPGPQFPWANTQAATQRARAAAMGQPTAAPSHDADAHERRLREVERKLDLILKHMEAQKPEPSRL
jgi:hypothetical protein